MKRAYIGEMCVHFFEMLFLKHNENAALSKNVCNKEKGPFLFEKRYFLLCLVVALIS